jgi:hypothetical protein
MSLYYGQPVSLEPVSLSDCCLISLKLIFNADRPPNIQKVGTFSYLEGTMATSLFILISI